MSRIAHFLDNRLTDGDEIVTLTRLSRFTPKKHFLVLTSVKVIPGTIVRLEGLGTSVIEFAIFRLAITIKSENM
jgi:hypothetical protein